MFQSIPGLTVQKGLYMDSKAYPLPSSTPRLRLVDERATYDAGPPPDQGHFTSVTDDIVDEIAGTLGLAALGLYLYLERRANKDGIAKVSYSRIAEDCKCSRRHAVDLIKLLASNNLVVVTTPDDARQNHKANDIFLPKHRRKLVNELVHDVHQASEEASERASAPRAPKVDTSKQEVGHAHVSEDARALGHAWYQALNLSKRPASPERFYADMQQLANAGITPDELKGEIAWLQGWAKNGISLRLVLSKIDEYRTIAPPADNVLTIGGMTYQLGVQP